MSKLRPSRTAEQLQAASNHVYYEAKMLLWSAAQTEVLSDGPEQNAAIESFCVHARNLFHFFGFKRGAVMSDDMLAEDFVSSWALNGKVPDTDPVGPGLWSEPFIQTYLTRLHRHLAHLSYDRITLADTDRPWPVPEMLRLLEDAVRKFDRDLVAPYRGEWWDKKPLEYPTRPIARVPTGPAGPIT